MSHLSPLDREMIRAALDAQRFKLLQTLKTAQAESGQTQFTEVLGRSSGDSGDEALAVTLGDLSAARMDHELRALRALEAAHARLDEAELGICEACGADIPVARLLIHPAATRCVHCQDHYERTHAGEHSGTF